MAPAQARMQIWHISVSHSRISPAPAHASPSHAPPATLSPQARPAAPARGTKGVPSGKISFIDIEMVPEETTHNGETIPFNAQMDM